MTTETDYRKRLLAISAATVALTLGNTAWDVIGPLWTSSQLHLGAADWAHIRSLRFTGTLVGTVLVGLVAAAWGARALGIACFLVASASLGLIAAGGRASIYLAIPFFGASISAVYVALNVLTQLVGAERQARANASYRSVGAAVAILAPVSATGLASLFGYTWALAAFALLFIAGGLVLFRHPREHADPAGKSFLASLRVVVKRPGLVKFLSTEQLFAMSTTGIGVFTALRLSKDFSSPDTLVGTFMTVAALAGFVGTVFSFRVQERLGIRRTIVIAYGAMASAWLGFGLAPDRSWALAALMVGNLALGFSSAPVSYTVARLGGEGSEASTVTFWKMIQGLGAVLGMNACALLEPSLGMAGIIVGGSLVAFLPVLIFARVDIRIK